jgi:hypothetical protein
VLVRLGASLTWPAEGRYISAALIVASFARASAIIRVIASVTLANLRESVTLGAAGQRIKMTAGVSVACTSSIVSWSAGVISPERRELRWALGICS